MKSKVFRLIGDLWWIPVLFVVWAALSLASSDSTLPLRYELEEKETLENAAERFGISPELLKKLNPVFSNGDRRILLICEPRDKNEAVELLEEARVSESSGGREVGKAAAIYAGILKAASLLPASRGQTDKPDAVEIPSETVAEALLGWGRVNEMSEPDRSRWAYGQIQAFFPDLAEVCVEADQRLSALDQNGVSILPDPPPSAVEMFPWEPHVVLDIDAKKLEREFSGISLYEALRPLENSGEKETSEFVKKLGEIDSVVTKVLKQVESIHLGARIDLDPAPGVSRKGHHEQSILAVAKLAGTPDDFVRGLDLGAPDGDFEGIDYWNVERDLVLAFKDGWAFFGRERDVELWKSRRPPQAYPSFTEAGSPYQRMRREVGTGATVFGFVNAEALLEGPALSFARNADLEKEGEEMVQSLLISGLLGINSIQGVALALSAEGGALVANLALAHGGKGIFYVLQSELCESPGPSYFPSNLDGMVSLKTACGSPIQAISHFVDLSLLGKAAPVYTAQYENVVERVSKELGFKLDPVELLNRGFGSELRVGVRFPEGIIPVPNAIVAIPVGDSRELFSSLEGVLAKELKMDFQEGEVEGQWYHRALLPGVPIAVEVAYTIIDDTFLAATHPGLLSDGIRGYQTGENLLSSPTYRDFQASIPSPGNLEVYFAPSLSKALALSGKSLASLSSIPDSRKDIRDILNGSLNQILENPGVSGLGFIFAPDRAQLSVRLSNFRPLLVGFLCLAKGKQPVKKVADTSPDSDRRVESASTAEANPPIAASLVEEKDLPSERLLERTRSLEETNEVSQPDLVSATAAQEELEKGP